MSAETLWLPVLEQKGGVLEQFVSAGGDFGEVYVWSAQRLPSNDAFSISFYGDTDQLGHS